MSISGWPQVALWEELQSGSNDARGSCYSSNGVPVEKQLGTSSRLIQAA